MGFSSGGSQPGAARPRPPSGALETVGAFGLSHTVPGVPCRRLVGGAMMPESECTAWNVSLDGSVLSFLGTIESIPVW